MSSAIVCEGLSKRYGSALALDGLDLEIREQTILGFLGLNGAGKTTTIKLLNGLIKPTEGNAYICGSSIRTAPLVLKSMIGYLSQEPAFYPWMTPGEFLGYVGELFGLKRETIRSRTRRLLKELDLEAVAGRRIGGFSTGMRQRLGIAQALMNEPKVLFLDEPVSALDPFGRIHVLDIIKSLRGKATILMSSHILADVERVCDEVAIIDHGRLVTHETLSTLRKHHFSRTILIHCLEPLQPLQDILRAQEFIQSAEYVAPTPEMPNGLKLVPADFDRAERTIPALLIQQGLTLRHYELVSPGLEDIFVTLVPDRTKEN